ncbi:MAG: TIGR00282 family metallophosphoesterase [Acetobacter sp.]|nr:TIGR00282 family metallophosphoesterase [Bacteroides sp.]MCM1342067.1 TIGR00282 family metallophosphoesterase [Acetobacter sp.]
MKILAVGDVVSAQGCRYLMDTLPKLKKELNTDIVIVNGENSAVGNGILPQSANTILDSGADIITLGNHSLRRKEIYDYLDDDNNPIIRPYNYHSSAPGKGYMIIDKGYIQIGVINLQGSIYMEQIRNPFDVIDNAVEELKQMGIRIILVDFHAEATSEKKAMAYYLDGRVSAVFGTHTHTQTSDNQIMPNGTGFISDLGMTGPYHSVLGIKPEIIIEKLRTNLPSRFICEDGPCILEGCLFEIDNNTGKTISTTLIRR